MMMRWRSLLAAMMVFGLGSPSAAEAQPSYQIVEPKKAKSPKQLGDGEGALHLSVRTQKQFTETLIVYFVALDADGRDTDRVIRIERGAGVPIMGSNMIDEKPQTYRVPAGRYRPIAFTVACDMMPTSPGQVCSRGFSTLYPTGFYPSGAPVFEVKAGELTQGGDFIVEFTGPKPPREQSLLDVKDTPIDWALRWRPGSDRAVGFDGLPVNQPTVPAMLQSRIVCAARPTGVTLYIPFDC